MSNPVQWTKRRNKKAVCSVCVNPELHDFPNLILAGEVVLLLLLLFYFFVLCCWWGWWGRPSDLIYCIWFDLSPLPCLRSWQNRLTGGTAESTFFAPLLLDAVAGPGTFSVLCFSASPHIHALTYIFIICNPQGLLFIRDLCWIFLQNSDTRQEFAGFDGHKNCFLSWNPNSTTGITSLFFLFWSVFLLKCPWARH